MTLEFNPDNAKELDKDLTASVEAPGFYCVTRNITFTATKEDAGQYIFAVPVIDNPVSGNFQIIQGKKNPAGDPMRTPKELYPTLTLKAASGQQIYSTQLEVTSGTRSGEAFLQSSETERQALAWITVSNNGDINIITSKGTLTRNASQLKKWPPEELLPYQFRAS